MKKIFAWFFLIGIIGLFLWVFISNFLEASPNVKAGLIGFAATVSGALIAHQKTRKREIDSRHFADKREGYIKFIDLLFSMIHAAKDGEEFEMENMEEAILAFKKAIMVWGEPDLIQTWNDYEMNADKLQGTPRAIMEMDKALRAIRKDLGHSDNTLNDGDLVGLILKAEDKEKLLGRR